MKNIYADKLKSLTVFRNILDDEAIHKLLNLFTTPNIENYSNFVFSLYKYTDCLSDYILNSLLENENVFVKRMALFDDVPKYILESVKRELTVLEEISAVTSEQVIKMITDNGVDVDVSLSAWENKALDFHAIYSERMNLLTEKGYGIFAKYNSFHFGNGKLIPVETPDLQKLSELTGYELERNKIISNTLALLNNKPALNVLLYGDAGTGKSSTVKAVLNEYSDKGLRLIEISKPQIKELPEIISIIAKNPLKFIIFIDDISFSAEDDSFGSLKAVLEGSASAKSLNAVIYATSNRRHLIKEKFSDREGDDIHANDTREQLTSLSERFGLKVPFLKPNKDVYLKIVENLAAQYDIPCDEELFRKAEAFSLRRNGRSGRAAKHFIESILAQL